MEVMLKDPALAEQGRAKVEFAGGRMPVLLLIREDFERRRPLQGVSIAGCLHVTTETANLCRTLIAGGAKMALCASNPLSTKDDVAAAIHADYGANVYAMYGCDRETFEHLFSNGRGLSPGVHPVPRDIDDRVASGKLRSLGVQPEQLTSAQQAYLTSWEIGT